MNLTNPTPKTSRWGRPPSARKPGTVSRLLKLYRADEIDDDALRAGRRLALDWDATEPSARPGFEKVDCSPFRGPSDSSLDAARRLRAVREALGLEDYITATLCAAEDASFPEIGETLRMDHKKAKALTIRALKLLALHYAETDGVLTPDQAMYARIEQKKAKKRP